MSAAQQIDAMRGALTVLLAKAERLYARLYYAEPWGHKHDIDFNAARAVLGAPAAPALDTPEPAMANGLTEDETSATKSVSGLSSKPVAPAVPDVTLTVWFGSMPESNGKENWTVILRRKSVAEVDLVARHALMSGVTINRSEYKDRMRYEADRLRYLIGELDKAPHILDYDANMRSSYAAPAVREPLSQEVLAVVVETLQGIFEADWRKWEELASADEFVRWAKSRANHALTVLAANGIQVKP